MSKCLCPIIDADIIVCFLGNDFQYLEQCTLYLSKHFRTRIPYFHKRDIIKNSEQKIRINLSQNWCVACIIMLNSPKNSIIYLISWWLSFKSISKCLKSTYWLFDNAHRVTTHLKLLCQVWNLWDTPNMLLFMSMDDPLPTYRPSLQLLLKNV